MLFPKAFPQTSICANKQHLHVLNYRGNIYKTQFEDYIHVHVGMHVHIHADLA